MYLIWMGEEQETQLPFLPPHENLEVLSSFMTGRSSRSNSLEEHDPPRQSAQDGIASFMRSYDDIEPFGDHDEQQPTRPKVLSLSLASAAGAALATDPYRDSASSSGDSQAGSSSEQLACLNCQKRKGKCDRGQPCCSCAALGLECTYLKAKKRGPKPGSMLRIKQESHHLKQAFKVLLQTLIGVNADFQDLGPSISQLLEDSHTFDAASCQSVIKGLTLCLSRSLQPNQESRSEAKGKAKGGIARK